MTAYRTMLQLLKRSAVGALTEIVAGTPMRRAFLNSVQSRVVIFTLHRLADPANGISGHDERVVIEVLQRVRRLRVPIVGLAEVLEAERGERSLPPVSVCFTLDDGYFEQGETLLPLLLAHDARPSLFLITGFLDGELWPWDARVQEFFRLAPRSVVEIRLGEGRLSLDLQSQASRSNARRCYTELCKTVTDDRREALVSALADAVGVPAELSAPAHHRPMTWERARELERLGARFGSHTVSHRLFSRTSADIAAQDLHLSRNRVEAELRNPLPIVAWPIGRVSDFGPRDLELAVQAGYAASVDVFSEDHVVRGGSSVARIPVLHRHGFPDRPYEASTLILGFRRAFDRWRRANGETRSGAVDLARVRRLVFVCKGNICRSPYAEALGRHLGFATLSCGISAAPGALADRSANSNALLRGIDLGDHRSRHLDDVALDSADLLVAMDRTHHSAVVRASRRSGAQWTDAAGWLRLHNGVDAIADPYGKSDLEFQTAFTLIEDAVGTLIRERQHCIESMVRGPLQPVQTSSSARVS